MSAAKSRGPGSAEEPTSQCCICHNRFDNYQIYEYRGILACGEHFDEAVFRRNAERAAVVAENNQQTAPFAGLNLTEGPIGRANQEILKAEITAAAVVGPRTSSYEERA